MALAFAILAGIFYCIGIVLLYIRSMWNSINSSMDEHFDSDLKKIRIGTASCIVSFIVGSFFAFMCWWVTAV